MTELIVFDDAEALAIGYLSGVLTGTLISSDVPAPRTGPVVTVLRAGGNRQNLISDGALLVFQAWADTKEEAYDLIKLVRAHVHAMPGNSINGTWVYKVTEASGPIYLPEPDDKTPRYQFTAQLRLRGTAI